MVRASDSRPRDPGSIPEPAGYPFLKKGELSTRVYCGQRERQEEMERNLRDAS